MNQHDQMQHDEERLEQLYWEFDRARKQSGEERLHFKGFMRGYASHVNETPKNEHDSDDVLKRAPLVRLTDEEVSRIANTSLEMYRGYSWEEGLAGFAKMIMDAMDKLNGGAK